MPLIDVDETKCKKDGLCADVCVARIIKRPDETHFPRTDPRFEATCIACGHCVAVCPTGALNNVRTPLADCQEIPKVPIPSADAVEALLKTRRSIRNYQDRPVPRELLERLMEVARHAPSGGNRQDYRFIICDDKAKLEAMTVMVIDFLHAQLEMNLPKEMELRYQNQILGWERGLDPILRHAPALIVAHSNTTLMPQQTNCILALSYIEVMAYALGLGALYCGYFNTPVNDWPELRDTIGLPPGHTAAATLLLGYPKIKYSRIPPRNPAKFRFL